MFNNMSTEKIIFIMGIGQWIYYINTYVFLPSFQELTLIRMNLLKILKTRFIKKISLISQTLDNYKNAIS